MNRARILVLGPRDQGEIKSALSAVVRDSTVEVEFAEQNGDVPDFATIKETDVVVFHSTSSATETFDETLRLLLDRYPYLPVVVVGGPDNERISPHTLGGVFYVKQDASPSLIASEVSRALQATWWWGVSDFDLPFVVVDANGLVVRANSVATSQFGDDIVGQAYRIAAERSQEPKLPDGHPIQKAFSTGKAVTQYYQYAGQGQDARWTNLLCRPITGLKQGTVRAVAVLFVEVNRWAQIVEAASVFQEKETLDELCEAIVQYAERLGFKRSRLYRFIEQDGLLRGKACIGLSDDNSRWFREVCEFPLKDDPPSLVTLHENRQHPVLFIKPDSFLGELPGQMTASGGVESDLVRYDYPRPEPRLEMEQVNRWVEAPLRVPTRAQSNGQIVHNNRLWGKLCVDLGDESDRLSAGDAADMALFASVASAAIAVVQNMETDRRHLQLFRQYSEQLAKADWRKPDKEILPNVIELLLEMYLAITGAAVVFYREKRSEDVLQLKGQPKWLAAPPKHCVVPNEKRRGEGASSTVLEQKVPQWGFENDAKQVADDLLRNAVADRWNEDEREFIRRIGSEIYLPVVVHGDLRGVIVAVAWNKGAFSSDLVVAVERFMYTAALWFELGELHDGRGWSVKILSELVVFLPLLAQAPRDDVFFAVLATILTARDGLAWNRVFIFNCKGREPNSAELVYALGGCGEATQGDVQKDTELIRLEKLVRTRISDPIPHGKDLREGRDRIDSLYELCVISPNKLNEPITIPFVKSDLELPFQDFLAEKNKLELPIRECHPLRWILSQDYSEAGSAKPLKLEGEAAWFEFMNRTFPRMFCAETSYAFPLWRTYEQEEKPLGLIVLEMREHRERPPEQTIPSTVVFLDLISGILAFRHHEQFVRGWIGGLPAFRHHLGLHDVWSAFLPHLDQIVREVEQRTGRSELVKVLESDRELLNLEVEQILRAQRAMEWLPQDLVEDLGAFLDTLAWKWEAERRFRVRRNWATAQGVRLGCPPNTLEETLQCLAENAVAANTAAQGEELEIRIDALCENSTSANFSSVIALSVTDTGPGIPDNVVQHIFLDGFTTHPRGVAPNVRKNKGRGLSVARAQLLMYHGDLQLAEPGPRKDPLDPSKTIGATFDIRFGVSVEAPSDADKPQAAKGVESHG